MRLKATIKNTLYAGVSYILLAIMTLLVRRVFLECIPVEMLGYEGLFGNIFTLLALADLGIETAILYRLFPAFAQNNYEEVNHLMTVYKILYRVVGIVVLTIGLVLIPLLKYIISENSLDWNYIYIIYILQLGSTLCTYFLAYRRILFYVSQREYVVTQIDTGTQIAANVLRLFILLVFHSYILYLLCNLLYALSGNIIITIRARKAFPEIDCNYKTDSLELKSLGIVEDLKKVGIQKVCCAIYGGTDNVLVSMFLGITQVGILSNYLLIQNYANAFMNKLLHPFFMSIGNYVYSEDKEKGYYMFRMFDWISFLGACVISCCYCNILNPLIAVIFGSRFLLTQGFVIALAINQYISWNHHFLADFRSTFGRYELDTFPIFMGALLNIVVSIILCKYMGITGIIVGTIIGQFGFWIGRVRVLYTEYISENIIKYIVRQIIRCFVWGSTLVVTWYISDMIETDTVGILLRIMINTLIPSLICILIYINSVEMRYVIGYIKRIIKIGE